MIGALMKIICDTHVLLFWADSPEKLSKKATIVLETGIKEESLACSDISLWEIALLFSRGRLRQDVDAAQYMEDILTAMSMEVLQVTPSIAVLAQTDIFSHKDPADRLIAATAINHGVKLITCDKYLLAVPGLQTIW
jgi:PIN domain nuclease of toxin-antitoxin system